MISLRLDLLVGILISDPEPQFLVLILFCFCHLRAGASQTTITFFLQDLDVTRRHQVAHAKDGALLNLVHTHVNDGVLVVCLVEEGLGVDTITEIIEMTMHGPRCGQPHRHVLAAVRGERIAYGLHYPEIFDHASALFYEAFRAQVRDECGVG